jgi:membrane-bound inhibitor of C-type lysozyme
LLKISVVHAASLAVLALSRLETVMPLPFQRSFVLALLVAGLPLISGAAPRSNPAVPANLETPGELVLASQHRRSRTEGVTAVKYPGGQFRKVGPRRWVEGRRNSGFQFREIGDDGRTITLLDRSRGVYIYLNLRREMIMYAEEGGDPRELYPITGIIKAIPDTDVEEMPEDIPEVPKMARYNCEEGVPMVVRFETRGERSLAFVSIDGSPERRLRQIPAASGAKYSDGEYTVWTKGRNATLEINGDIDICTGR